MFDERKKMILLIGGVVLVLVLAIVSWTGRLSKGGLRPGGLSPSNTSPISSAVTTGSSLMIPPGYRAVVLPLDPLLTGNALLKETHFVDVLATFELEGTTGSDEDRTLTLLQNVQVLETDTKGKGSITLSLKPQDVQNLLFAQQKGAIHLALRPFADEEIQTLKATDTTGLLGVEGLAKSRGMYREYRGKR